MDLNEYDIELLDRFVKEELSQDELKSLQERMKNPEFAAEVKSYLDTLEVIKAAGRGEMRTMLTAIHVDVSQSGELEKYKPGRPGNPGGGSVIGKIITWLFIAGAGYFGYQYYLEYKHEQMNNTIVPVQDSLRKNTIQRDTIYHYKIVRDTVYRYKTKTKVIRNAGDTVGFGNSVILAADTKYMMVTPNGDTVEGFQLK